MIFTEKNGMFFIFFFNLTDYCGVGTTKSKGVGLQRF